jgi:tetratricopeptide (TPR) repeat protein
MRTDVFSRPLFHLLLIIVLSILVYANTFNVPFLFDDNPNIVENPIVMDLKYFTQPSEAEFLSGTFQYNEFMKRFIGYLSFALNYKAHGLDVRGYHVVNLLIHVINGILLYSLVVLSFRTPWLRDSSIMNNSRLVALFSALLFVSHPVQTQAVTYIVQRLASLATMFYLMSLVLYVGWRLRTEARSSESGVWKKYAFFILSLVSAVLAMKTKEIAFTLPLVITLYEFLFFTGKVKMRLLRLMPFLLTMLIIPLTFVGLYSDIDKPVGEMMTDADEFTTIQEISRTDYLLTEQRVLVTYLRLLVFPVGQSFDYKYPIYHSFLNPPVCLSFLLLLFIFCLGLYFFFRSRVTENSPEFGVWSSDMHSSLIDHRSLRLIAFGILWFFLTASVESSIIPLHVIYEHRVYLPSVGVCIAVSTALYFLLRRGKGKIALLVMAMVVITFSAATYARNGIWRNEISLWEDVVKKYPLNVRAYSNLSDAYYEKGMLDDAVRNYVKAIELAPDVPQAHNNLALVYLEKGMAEKAIEHYKEALRLDPENPLRHSRIANAYMEMEMADKALEHFEITVRLNPDNATAHNELGSAYKSKGMFDKAIEHYRLATELEPRNPIGYFNLGNIYLSMGLFDNVVQLYQIVLTVDPDYAEAHFNLGLVYFQQGNKEKARKEFEAALRINPGYDKARKSLERINKKQ